MDITPIFGPLAFLCIFHSSVQGEVWPLKGAEVGDHFYRKQVSLERKDDGETYVIHAIREHPRSAPTVTEIVHGPFKLRGFGPYSMLVANMWLNTDVYVSVTFHDPTVAREFYHVLNPHHSQTFLNAFKIKKLNLPSLEGVQIGKFEEAVPKALDIFILMPSTGRDSRARSYVVHNLEGNQEPILIFHSSEIELTVNDDYLMLSITPQKSPTKYRFKMAFDEPSVAKHIVNAHTTLMSFRSEINLKDLEALDINTYPSRPMLNDQGESSNSGTQSMES